MTELWERALDSLRGRLSAENFDTWLAPVRCEGFEGDTVVLRIPNRFYADWITNHYHELLLDALAEVWTEDDSPARLRFEIDEALQAPSKRLDVMAPPAARVKPRPAVRRDPTPTRFTDLNPKYSFDNFVVGPSNQLAHAACVAVGDAPGKRYNPLFIYGGVGLGKTHLMNAMGHRILQDKPDAVILYLSAERFTNEFIWSLQNHRIDEFRKRYREQCDVLLMDDIQFLAGRDQTQEEFFHTFNALYHSDRQIVVTSDVYPQQIVEMEERLISRFQSGMVADIQPPELDTRIAILKKKAEAEKIHLTDDVALFIAQVVKSNVRELEGTLLRIAVKAELLGRGIDLDLTKDALRAALPAPEQALTVEDVQRAVCTYFNLKLGDLKSKRRHRAVSYPRQVAMYLCRQRLGTSYPELGERFGGKDHTTVISAVRKIDGLVEAEDETTQRALEAIGRKLGL
ncbi:MAG: chromosomal replication initiator protein DnaA [Sandaracinus sp.]|nr:chromosomal replication initiator protein DnaA [Sandaracinus sp.]